MNVDALANALRIAVEHLARAGEPRQNFEQFLAIACDALQIGRDSGTAERWRKMHREAPR